MDNQSIKFKKLSQEKKEVIEHVLGLTREINVLKRKQEQIEKDMQSECNHQWEREHTYQFQTPSWTVCKSCGKFK